MQILAAPPKRSKLPVKLAAPPSVDNVKEKTEPKQLFYTTFSNNRFSVKFEDKIFGLKINGTKFEAFMQNTSTKENTIIQTILKTIKTEYNTGKTFDEIKKMFDKGNFATSLKVFINHINKTDNIEALPA